MKFPELSDFLKEIVADEEQFPIVRHEVIHPRLLLKGIALK